MRDAHLVEPALGGDAGALDILAALDFGFTQRLDAGDVELLERPAAFDLGCLDGTLALDFRGLDRCLRGQLGAADFGFRDRACGLLRCEVDDTGFLGRLHLALALDVDHFAALLARDAFLFQLQFGGNPGPLDAFAPRDVGRLDRLVAGDLLGAGGQLGLDPLGRYALLARDASRIDGPASRDLGRLHRLLPLDLQRPDAQVLANAQFGDFGRLHDAQAFGGLARGDLGLFEALLTRNLAPAHVLFAADPGLREDQCLRHPRLFGFLAGGNLGLLDAALAVDFHRLRFAVLLDARLRQGLFLQDARALGRFTRGDLGGLEQSRPFDLTRCRLLLVDDARFLEGALLQDASGFDVLAGGDLLQLDRLGPSDLAPADFDVRRNARLCDGPLIGDARPLDGFASKDLGGLGLRLAFGALLCQQRALLRPAEFDVAFLLEPGLFARPLDLERLLLGFQVARADLDGCVLLDVVAQLAPILDVLDEDGEALGVEPVGGIEELQARLIDVEDGDELEFEPVARQIRLYGVSHALHIVRAVLVHAAHVHRRCGPAHRTFEFAGEQRVQAFGLQRASPERGGGHRHGAALGLDADVELGLDIDAHAILRDQRFAGGARHLEGQGVHVHGRDLVDHRPDEGAAVDDDLFAEEPRPDECDLLGRAAIEPLQNPEDDGDDHHRDDEPEDQLADHFS